MMTYIFTYILIIINVIVFFLISNGKLESEFLGSSYHLIFNRKDYKRLVTGAFTHEDLIHLLFNMISLYNIGTFVESYFGHWIFLLIYFVSMIVGKILSLLIRHANHDDYTMSIGASGAICGLLGAYFMVILNYYGAAGFSYLLRPMISLVMMSILPNVDGTSHFCSMGVGMLIAFLIWRVF